MKMKKLSMMFAAGAMLAGVSAAETAAPAPAAKAEAPAAKTEAPAAKVEAPAAKPQTPADVWSFLPEVVAKMDGKEITRKQFVDFITPQLAGPDGKMPPMVTADMLRQIAPMQVKAYIDQQLLLAAAEKAGFKPSAELVKQEMTQQLQKVPKEQMEMIKMQLQIQNKTIDSYIDEMAKNVQQQQAVAINKYLEKDLFGKIAVTEADAKAYYDANAARFKEPADAPDQIRASHILIALDKDATEAQVKEARDKAEKILADLQKNPAAFADLARENSSCPSKEQGGSLGAFGKGQMVKPFEEAAFGLKEGEMAPTVVKTDFGFHIIRRDAAVKERVIPFAEVKDRLIEGLKGQKMEEAAEALVADLEKANKVEILVKEAPLPNGFGEAPAGK